MEWLKSVNETIRYIEDNLTNKLSNEEIASQVFASNAHYQRIFHLITGITIGEYVRNRRLSMAGQDLLLTNMKVVDVALKYNYETSESFTKAFTRFHGLRPSEAKLYGDKLKFFYPFVIEISLRGGYHMTNKMVDEFYWNEIVSQDTSALTDEEKYQKIVRWAGEARGKNPEVFDSLCDWILDDAEWTEDKLFENKQILMQGVIARFVSQNLQLRKYLSGIGKSGIVNDAIYIALKRFDEELAGVAHEEKLKSFVAQMFNDFSSMRDRNVRVHIAGLKKGPTGTEYEASGIYGYINFLKDCDAAVQWALFMPNLVKRQQRLFKVKRFEYKSLPAMRFIGQECDEKNKKRRAEILRELDRLDEYRSEIKNDVLLYHIKGECVGRPEYRLFGRFMKADTPIPDGFEAIEFLPVNDRKKGPPFLSQFAYAEFEGLKFAMHMKIGYDGCAMYDITRNIMLGQNVSIPYPDKYWFAEVFLNGYKKPSTAFLFCAELPSDVSNI